MKHDNPKKRKQICETVELNEPAAKHKCSEVIPGSNSDELVMEVVESKDTNVVASKYMEIMDVTDKSAQDSNSSPVNSSSSRASWSNVLSGISKLDDRISSSVDHEHEEIVNSNEGLYPLENNGFPDIDCLDECFNAEYTDKQQTAEGLEEFIAATGVDRNMFLQPSHKWGFGEETQPDKQKPTIDKEFEHYFSMLML